MLILRIKQAECALADGRLDEAFDLLQDPAIRSHRQGQELLGQLVQSLVQRGRDHLAAKRWAQASVDAEKAGKLAGNLAQVAQLRMDLAQALGRDQQLQRENAQRIADARRYIERGQISIGQKVLAEAGADDRQAAMLQQHVEQRRHIADMAVDKARHALTRQQWGDAIEHLDQARDASPAYLPVMELTLEVQSAITSRIRESINVGRLDRAATLSQRLAQIAGDSVEAQETEQLVVACRDAWEFLQHGQPQRAEEILKRLATLLPDAVWLKPVLQQVQTASEATAQLRVSPLGLLDSAPMSAGEHRPSMTAAEPVMNTNPNPVLPNRFFLQVDGVGTFSIFRSDQITIGPISSSRVADLALLADANLPPITLSRTDEDYFLRSDRPIQVNDKQCTQKLLANHDRIALSPRCRLTFALPNPASTSAVLDLSGSRCPRGDVRRAILMDQEIIIGPGPSAHIRADSLASPLILRLNAGQLRCQAGGTDHILCPDVPISIASLSITLTST